MAGQVTIYPLKVELLGSGDFIRIEIKSGAFHDCSVVFLRPRTKSVQAVYEDLKARAHRGDKARIGDISWPDGEVEPWAFQYREKVGGKRAAPDPDHAVLRHYEALGGGG